MKMWSSTHLERVGGNPSTLHQHQQDVCRHLVLIANLSEPGRRMTRPGHSLKAVGILRYAWAAGHIADRGL